MFNQSEHRNQSSHLRHKTSSHGGSWTLIKSVCLIKNYSDKQEISVIKERKEDWWVWLHTIIHPLHHRSSLFHTSRRSACSRPVGAQVVSRRMENATQRSQRPSQARRPLWCAASWPPSPAGHPQPLPCRMTDGRFPTTTCVAAAKCQTSCTAVIRALKTETWGTLVFRLTLEKEDRLQTQALNPHLAD